MGFLGQARDKEGSLSPWGSWDVRLVGLEKSGGPPVPFNAIGSPTAFPASNVINHAKPINSFLSVLPFFVFFFIYR